MSATRDKSQKVAFVYSNLYQIYKKGKEAAINAEVSPSPVGFVRISSEETLHQAQVLKAQSGQVREYSPAEFIGKRVAKPEILKQAQQTAQAAVPPRNPALESLKDNVKKLTDLQSRLHFMLQELEDLVKE